MAPSTGLDAVRAATAAMRVGYREKAGDREKGIRDPIRRGLYPRLEIRRRLRWFYLGLAALLVLLMFLRRPSFVAHQPSELDEEAGEVVSQGRPHLWAVANRRWRLKEDPGQAEQSMQVMLPIRQRLRGPLNTALAAVKTRSFGSLTALPVDQAWQRLPEAPETPIEKSARDAYAAGAQALADLKESLKTASDGLGAPPAGTTSLRSSKEPVECRQSIFATGGKILKNGNLVELPCGMAIGSAITIIGKVSTVIPEDITNALIVFHVDLEGLRVVNGEDPPKIFHLNPRLNGDWSGRQVVEVNTCYRSGWGTAQRCEGWQSLDAEEKVDGLRHCEAWGPPAAEEPEVKDKPDSGWLQRLMHHTNQERLDWPFPFVRNKTLVLTIRAGWEGFHVYVDGLHVTSFHYRTGYPVEEATGVSIGGDFEVESFIATSLPKQPPTQRRAVLEFSPELKAPPLKGGPVKMFIGILSSSNHFEERMGVRKTWLQSPLVRSGEVVARFFLALHPTREVNEEVQKEADVYGDMEVLPFIDRYDLVVLKTVAICQFAVKHIDTRFLMKADDDNFVRVDRALQEAQRQDAKRQPFYMGKFNVDHQPLREGKWAVTTEEWPEEVYPAYANGPGYIITVDIAAWIAKMREMNVLRIFKMEDVSMGVWVGQYLSLASVQLVHSPQFCQDGCIDDYITAHYQNPRQMACLWAKLQNCQLGAPLLKLAGAQKAGHAGRLNEDIRQKDGFPSERTAAGPRTRRQDSQALDMREPCQVEVAGPGPVRDIGQGGILSSFNTHGVLIATGRSAEAGVTVRLAVALLQD